MASRFFVALAPVAVVAVVAGACSNSALNDHPVSDGGLPSTGGASSTTSAPSTSNSSSTHASSTSVGTGGMTGAGGAGATSTGTGGMTSTSAGGAGGAGGADAGPDAASCTGTDTNCGGNCPQPCGDGLHCTQGTDCASLSCVMGKCAAPTCMDQIQNGMETDVDCGGPLCPKCADDQKCGSGATAGSNCLDKICTNGVCQAATCSDGVQNGSESDVDCGGTCLPCYPGQKCNTGSDCAENICSGLCACPQGMVVAPIQGAGSYCIDANEVSYGQYQLFYNANPATADQDASCMWNVNWTPSDNWPQPQTNANNPVTNVNWCQAAAYCKYVGHHLCGQIGSVAAVPVSFADFANFHRDQWYNACTADGTNVYPYSSSYRSAACNGIDSVDGGSPGPEAPSNLQSCLGGETGLFEMSGNVAEWENACDGNTGSSDDCLIRGGSYLDGATKLRCDSGGTPVSQHRDYQGPDVGFRCCF